MTHEMGFLLAVRKIKIVRVHGRLDIMMTTNETVGCVY